jgi:hypothetical protein
MARLITALLCLTSLLLSLSNAHFLLNYPPTIGFDDDLETTAPCGSFTPDFSKDNVTDFHVGGDAVALTSIHPEATWLFRATLDQTAGGNWTQLLPPIVQTGLGAFCEKAVVIPATWAGSKGIIGIVQDAPDGILYQCAAVNFVTGTGTPPSACKNVTGLSASYTSDASLSSLPATAAATGSSTGATTSTTTSATTSAKPSAANAMLSLNGLKGIAGLVVIAGVTAAAFLL